MNIQKSFTKHEGQGTLYIVPTPIGNLEDMTFRAVSILKEADTIAAEDTRNTKKLLNHFEISTPLTSYHEHNKYTKGPQLLGQINEGQTIAVVSDAGMPGISDPGADLVKEAIEQELSVVVLPGCNAALPALVGSGLSTDQFYFYGFLPRKKKERQAVLEALNNQRSTIIFYESPHRLKEMLSHLYAQFGNRQITLARELTKRYEEYVRGSLEEVIQWTSEGEVRGEFCVIVEGAQEEEETAGQIWWGHLSIKEHVEYYISHQQMPPKEAIKQTSVDRNMKKRDVYQAFHVES
ncbi:16S rRNA (cytidine(1402)-2'-O)-methyltransferase [Halobacillus massiliensis]|uniref:16S rRNA (cytidine(1402)-2'-O)-methyltransferase n=1 Tax=Halobacillus massiliensis TaxID=1926286 RepID=UPI0009E40BF4|nr:16S rRNA (cytidine(1402)-2'-O)-methyltransferase [Halobacillus massiliensis]